MLIDGKQLKNGSVTKDKLMASDNLTSTRLKFHKPFNGSQGNTFLTSAVGDPPQFVGQRFFYATGLMEGIYDFAAYEGELMLLINGIAYEIGWPEAGDDSPVAAFFARVNITSRRLLLIYPNQEDRNTALELGTSESPVMAGFVLNSDVIGYSVDSNDQIQIVGHLRTF